MAAPMPLTSTSLFISAKQGLFHSPLGFSIDAGRTNWLLEPKPKNNHFIETIYKAPAGSGSEAILTVRSDKINGRVDAAHYAKRWLSDYPRFGFEVLDAKKVKVDGQMAYLIDLVSHESSKQLRQVLFVRGDDAVTLTCRDKIQDFAKTLKSCDQIIRTFHW